MTLSRSYPMNGLVLAGGESRRMQFDKAAMKIDGKTQLDRTYELVSQFCERVYVSVRSDQAGETIRREYPQIIDVLTDIGPAAGIIAALDEDPDVAWLVVACDLPLLDSKTLEHLVHNRNPKRVATAYRSSYDDLPEPLCAIYEPGARTAIREFIGEGLNCPRKMLLKSDIELLQQLQPGALENVNTPDDLRRVGAQAESDTVS